MEFGGLNACIGVSWSSGVRYLPPKCKYIPENRCAQGLESASHSCSALRQEDEDKIKDRNFMENV